MFNIAHHAVAILFVLFCSRITAVDGNTFINPPPLDLNTPDQTSNPVYDFGDRINIQWQSDYEAANLIMWQPATNNYVYLLNSTTGQNLFWTVTPLGFNLDGVNTTTNTLFRTFYFAVYNSTVQGNDGFFSRRIDITGPSSTTSDIVPTVTSPGRATVAAASSTSPTSSTTVAATTIQATMATSAVAAAAAAATESQSPGLSLQARVGLGAGIAAGVTLIAVVLGIFFLRRRKRTISYQQAGVAHDNASAAAWGNGSEKMGGSYKQPIPMQEMASTTYKVHEPPQEMENTLLVSELDSASKTHEPVELMGSTTYH